VVGCRAPVPQPRLDLRPGDVWMEGVKRDPLRRGGLGGAPRPGTGTLKFVKDSEAEIERKFRIRQGASGGCPILSRLLR